MTDKPPAMPELPEPFALSLSIHDGENCKWPLLECRLLQKHPAEKQHLYTADQMRAYALAAQQSAQPAEVSDEQIVAALEAAGVKFQRFMGGISGTKDCWSTAGSQDARKLTAGVRAILALRPQAVPMMDEPFLKVHKGEICYKSDADDQSYGMWCPVNWDTEHGFSDGTVFYAHHGITQRADDAHQPTKEPSE